MTEWVLLALSFGLVAVCGVFVAGEFALMTADRSAVERAAEAGDRRAGGVLAALRSLSTQLSGVQIAITLTNLAIGFLSEPAIAQLLHAPLGAIGVHGNTADGVAVAIALVASTVLTMVFGELVPKNLALAMPIAVARAVQGPIRGFTRVMRVPIQALNRAADAILRRFGLEAREELASARTPEELLSVVRHSADEGTLAVGTATLLVRSLTFAEKHARDVITARPQMVTVDADDTVAAMLDVVRASGHSRLPVLGPRGLDDVVGVIELDQAVAVPVERRATVAVRDVMAAAVEVPESLPLDAVLRALQTASTQLALVVDEYGGTAGVVTGEDLLEELVGEVEDEHHEPVPPTRRVGAGFDVSGLLRPDEVRAATGLTLPEHGVYETVGGLVMRELGRLPVAGDRLEVGDVALTVLRLDGRRVDRLLIASRSEEGA